MQCQWQEDSSLIVAMEMACGSRCAWPIPRMQGSCVQTPSSPCSHISTMTFSAQIIRDLIKAGADVHGQNQLGWSALHRAAIRNRADAAVCLLQCGASSNITDLAGRTPLHHACSFSSLDVVRKLCEWNALPDVLDFCGLKCWGVSQFDALLPLIWKH